MCPRQAVTGFINRIDEDLQPQGRPLAARTALGHGRGQITSGRITADRETPRIDADRRPLPGQPSDRGEAVLPAGVQVVLGCQPVPDGDDERAADAGQVATDRIGSRQPPTRKPPPWHQRKAGEPPVARAARPEAIIKTV